MFALNPTTGEIEPKNNANPTDQQIQKGYFKELFLEIDEVCNSHNKSFIISFTIQNHPFYINITQI